MAAKSPLFGKVQSLWDDPDTGLFVSRLSYQIRAHVSWKRDPEAVAVDACSSSRQGPGQFVNGFPPFSLINKI